MAPRMAPLVKAASVAVTAGSQFQPRSWSGERREKT
jgi:hypothetical protein